MSEDLRLGIKERRLLLTAFVSSYPNFGEVRVDVRLNLDERLVDIKENLSLREGSFSLIEWAEERGKVQALVSMLVAERPENPDVKALVSHLSPTPPAAERGSSRAQAEARPTDLNPFSSSQPDKLFVGYGEELGRVMRDLQNANNSMLAGGRRCGKTSFLLQVGERIRRDGVPGFQAFPRRIDLGGQVPHSTFEFFAIIYREVVKECPGVEAWEQAPASQPYQAFLKRMEAAAPKLEKTYGANWLAVLLIDKLDRAKGEERLDLENPGHTEVFQYLRNLLYSDGLKRHFRLVASGGSDMYRLSREGSPLANILRTAWLRRLNEAEADELIAVGPAEWRGLRNELFALTGRHAYLLQGLLERLWDSPGDLGGVTNRFAKDVRGLFEYWVRILGPERKAVYHAIAEAEAEAEGGRAASIEEIQKGSKVSNIDEALQVLSFHGVIDDSENDHLRISGTMFRDWFRRSAGV